MHLSILCFILFVRSAAAVCDGRRYDELTDAFGQALKPASPLIHVEGSTHTVGEDS